MVRRLQISCGINSVGRVTALHAVCRTFKSSIPHQIKLLNGVLDSLVVHLPWAQVVVGSNPSTPTNMIFFKGDWHSGYCTCFACRLSRVRVPHLPPSLVISASGIDVGLKTVYLMFQRQPYDIRELKQVKILTWSQYPQPKSPPARCRVDQRGSCCHEGVHPKWDNSRINQE